MRPELAFEFSRVTEAAALAAYDWLGRGDKNTADGAAVEAMRHMLNQINMSGKIVIGEGEIDEAPMLFIGEQVGKGGDCGVDIAVDPIEGTRMTAMGQSNAVAVLAAGEKDSFLAAPDMYMEKLVTGPGAVGAIDLELSLEENIRASASSLNKDLSEFTVVTLAKPRHENTIKQIHALGCRVFALPDGDVAASILTCLPQSDVDMMYCIGGAPEGVISAAAIRALGGDMQAKLMLRSEVKGNTASNLEADMTERKRCAEMHVEPNKIMRLNDMASSDNVVFAATGITKGDLLDGVCQQGRLATTESLLISGLSRSIRIIKTTHHLSRKARDN
jgi:fructose-1,6-bisphosphatase II